jgi:hypothetical protein
MKGALKVLSVVTMLTAVTVPLRAQEVVFGGQERQFAGTWSDWPNGYVSTTLADRDQPLIPIFEGWYPNPDGTLDLSFSYLNMNFVETFHIPIGPDNFLEPSEYNGMQPTFFMPAPPRGRDAERRHYRHQAAFAVNVPADFGDADLVWTLRYKGMTVKVPGRTTIETYRMENLEASTSAPFAAGMRLEPSGPEGIGRSGPVTTDAIRARVGVPVELSASVTPLNDEPHLVFFFAHQGPAAVAFEPSETEVPGEGGEASTMATFSEAGEHLVRVSALQSVSSLVQHCCYTNGYIRVTVTQ